MINNVNETLIGKKVRFVGKPTSEFYELFAPDSDTIGTITDVCGGDMEVEWPKGSVVNDGAFWYTKNELELVEEMTNEEIWEMLKPKMEKLGINYNEVYIGYRSILIDIPTIQKLVATTYRSGYGRGQKGRSFKIGEKKQQGPHWEWIKPNEIVPDGTKVRYMKRAEDDDGHNPYYPKIGQECIKLNPSWWSDSDFWVQFEGSEYEYTCFNSSRDCFQKWVEDDE